MFLKIQKKKLWGTLNIHVKYNSTERSTLQKINSQRIHYFCSLEQKGNKKVVKQLAVQIQPHHLRETEFHGIIDMLLITARGWAQHPVILFFVWELTLMIFKLVPSLLKGCYFNLAIRTSHSYPVPMKINSKI